VVDIPQESPGILEKEIGGPVEEISSTFLQGILSEQMDMGKEYDLNVQAIVHELEESGREAGLGGSPSRSFKEELIENEEMSRNIRNGGDGKVSSESTEETEKIVIEDSAEEESFVIGTVITDKKEGDEEQPEPPGEISTLRLSESTPVIRQTMERGVREEKDRSRPLYVAKKKYGLSLREHLMRMRITAQMANISLVDGRW